MSAVSDSRTIVASANAGCDGGVLTGAHDAAVTFQFNVTTAGPDAVGGGCGVGAVGDDDVEQPIASNNINEQSESFTTIPPLPAVAFRAGGLPAEAECEGGLTRGDRVLRVDYSDVMPAGPWKKAATCVCVRGAD